MKRIWISSIREWPFQEGPLSIMGPTGCGKTQTALDYVQENFPGDLKEPLLVSVDAVACYAGLDIGSAKVLGKDRENYSWCGIDLVLPQIRMNAALFVKSLNEDVQSAHSQKRPMIFVGGSHFYEKALIEGMSSGEESSPGFLQGLKTLTNEILRERLLKCDARFEKIHLNDRYRLERYLDLAERQGISYEKLSDLSTQSIFEKVYCLALGMDFDRDDYEKKLKLRIEAMFKLGWREEVKALIECYTTTAPALLSVGYSEITQNLMGAHETQSELEYRILVSHRQLAKKQRTWIRGLQKK